jgi:hypothetical protein
MNYIKKFASVFLTVAILTISFPAVRGVPVFQEQLTSAAVGEVVQLQQPITEALAVEKDACIDLNGFPVSAPVTVKEGCTLYVMDGRTDDFTVTDGEGYGTISEFYGNVLPMEGYLKLTLENGTSFHRVDMNITSMSLRATCAGIYYTGSFFGDELVAENVRSFGIALRIDQAPDEAYMRTTSAYSCYREFQAGEWGNEATGTLLTGVMKPQNTNSVNNQQSKWKIWGCPYILTEDGTYTFGQIAKRSLMEQVQAADAMWAKLTATQKSELKAMCRTYADIVDNWYLPHIFNTDIDVPI